MWIIGDVHGCIKTFEALLSKLPESEPKCLVGDLIDRGPGSKEVIERAIKDGIESVMGNHELMMLSALKLEIPAIKVDLSGSYGIMDFRNVWLRNGGTTTLTSYTTIGNDCKGVLEFPEDHIKWMCELPLYREYLASNDDGRTLFVSHSSVHGRIDLSDMKPWDDSSIIWNRYPPMNMAGKFQIFGHTPLRKVFKKNYCMNIDTGCVYGLRLTAVHFPSMKIVRQKVLDCL